MPNRMHGIIFINIVGATTWGRPAIMNGQNPKTELTPEEIEIVEGKGVK